MFSSGYDPNLVRNHLNKLFPNVESLETVENSPIYQIVAFTSKDGEVVNLSTVYILFLNF